MNIELLTPGNWEDYELLDSGGKEKLERFGKYVTARPEPQALWNKSLPEEKWHEAAQAYFSKDRNSDERGEWICSGSMPSQWQISYKYRAMEIRMRLGLTSFKHVGIFPEQASNWDFIYDKLLEIKERTGSVPSALNLFAYTGGATLAARAAGAEVTHVDSVKQVVSWSKENMEISGLDSVRWIVDDALKFARREVKRGRKYNAVILDPPAYGRGPDGEKWVLEENLNEMLTLCGQLLEENNSFLILNLYSMGLSALLARTAVRELAGKFAGEQLGELYFDDKSGRSLPLGVFYRGWR